MEMVIMNVQTTVQVCAAVWLLILHLVLHVLWMQLPESC